MSSKHWVVVIVLWLAAGAQYFWFAPLLQRLAADYANETHYVAVSQFRDSMKAPWTSSDLIARRVDQTLVSSANHAIVQGDLHWTNLQGVVEYESSAVYGVDRNTRENLPGYGNVERDGAYFFPPNTERKTYRIWNAQYGGAYSASFQRDIALDGVALYEFKFALSALDESAGYAHLADVPERYQARTDAVGTLWVEPLSGTLVDYQEQGHSYFFDPRARKVIGDFYIFKSRTSPESRKALLQTAQLERRRILVFKYWIPLGLLAASLAVIAGAFYRRGRRSEPGSAKAGEVRA